MVKNYTQKNSSFYIYKVRVHAKLQYKLFINGEDTHILANIKLDFSMVGHYTHTCQHKGYSLTVCSW